jgi:hypothetical protein
VGHSRPEDSLVCAAGKGCTVNGGQWTTIGGRYGETPRLVSPPEAVSLRSTAPAAGRCGHTTSKACAGVLRERRGGGQRATQQGPRKSAHCAGFICPHCPHSKTVCPQCNWGRISSMVTTTYARFCGLSPLSPRKKNDPPKETAKSEAHTVPWCPHFRGHFAHLVAIGWAPPRYPPS